MRGVKAVSPLKDGGVQGKHILGRRPCGAAAAPASSAGGSHIQEVSRYVGLKSTYGC